MFNFYRWFSDGLIFFVAPTKPLVAQQVESFVNTVSEVPLKDIKELQGNVSAFKRAEAYRSNRIFFMTPQTLQNDLERKALSPEKIVLLVIDEAHRATGNYAYCKIIQLIEEARTGFRILSLSATPVSKLENLQTVVNSLRVSNFEVRDEDDSEVKKYAYDKNIVEVFVEKENNVTSMEVHIFKMMEPVIDFLKRAGLLSPSTHPKFMNQMTILNLQDDVRTKAAQGKYSQEMVATVF